MEYLAKGTTFTARGHLDHDCLQTCGYSSTEECTVCVPGDLCFLSASAELQRSFSFLANSLTAPVSDVSSTSERYIFEMILSAVLVLPRL